MQHIKMQAGIVFSFFIFFGGSVSFSQSMFTNSSYETGVNTNCNCATGYVCANDAGRVVQGFHPNFVVGNQGCIGGQNYFPPFGAHTGSCCVYFYAGLDRITTPSANFLTGDKVCICVWYAGPQGSGALGQNTTNSYFRIGVDGIGVSPNILVPVNTMWTQYCYLATLTAGAHTFCIMSGGAAQYSIWNDDFTVNICAALPIELLDLDAKNRNGEVMVTWKTASEVNNDHFTLERSRDGVEFSAIETIKGAGNSQKVLNYKAYDKDPYKGISYYRLKQTDVNGQTTNSHLVYVNTESEIKISVYPNPNNGNFKIDLDEDIEGVELILLNSMGEIIYTQTVVTGSNEINIPEKAKGIYNLMVLRDKQKVYSGKITIDR